MRAAVRIALTFAGLVITVVLADVVLRRALDGDLEPFWAARTETRRG